MMLENLLNKYEENRKLTNEQLSDTIKKLEHEELLDEDTKKWLYDDWHSCVGQLSVYDCVIRDIKKLLGKED